MFTKTAEYYDALYHFKDYKTAAEQLHRLIQAHNHDAGTLLDVGCGTGQHLAVLQDFYRVEGLDIDPNLLRVARRRCPNIKFHEKDMVGFELSSTYDVVSCLFSSIGYVKSLDRMEKAVISMARHLRPGGILVVEPWLTPESYWVGRITANFVDQPELKIAWMYTSELRDRLSIFDISYLVGTPDGVNHFVEKHEMGLFAHDEYLSAFEKAELEVKYDPKGLFGRGMYTGFKPTSQKPAFR